MAAMFEMPEESEETSPPKSQSRTQSLISQFSQVEVGSPTKSLRSSGSGSNWTQSPRKPSSSSGNPARSRNPSVTIGQRSSSLADPNLTNAISENLAARAESIRGSPTPVHSVGPQTPQKTNLRHPLLARKPVAEGGKRTNEGLLQTPPSLGTMTPYLEQPPIAQHLNFLRPSSSTSDMRDGQFQGSGTPTPRPSSATVLHAQIRALQRQLDAKIEEAAQLRRQLDVHENTEVGTLSQQLREAKREALMWKDRAEAAERRVKVFERFTARLRGIREAVTEADGHDGDDTAHDDHEHGSKGTFAGKNLYGGRKVSDTQSDSSRRTEDAGVVTARIRTCLHGGGDGPGDVSPASWRHSSDKDARTGLESKAQVDFSQGALEIWMAAQELLELEESGTRDLWGV